MAASRHAPFSRTLIAQPCRSTTIAPPSALTGDIDTLNEREVLRLLLNLSVQETRALHYVDADPLTTEFLADESYIRVKDPEQLQTRGGVALIPPRTGGTVHGLAFASNRVLHSGLDDEHGHFVAA